MDRVVILLSGGLDSAAQLALAKKNGPVDLCITAHYGQRAADREIEAARKLSSFYGSEHKVVECSFLSETSSSRLTQKGSNLNLIGADNLDLAKDANASAQAVWVSNRNGVLIEMAAAFAESLCDRYGGNTRAKVLVGFNREEAATFPDNSEPYLHALNQALVYSTRGRVSLDCFTLKLDKREIVAKLRSECPEFPFDQVWSCYTEGPAPCGQCESCHRFRRALK